MSESLRMWIEVGFNISYLLVVWSIVTVMVLQRSRVSVADQAVAQRMRWAFALLALGDTGHVGFRVVAYLTGGLQAHPALVGLGALSTAYTVTIFYMLVLDIWRLRFQRKLGWFGWSLIAAGVVRLVVMAFPQNQWTQVLPPYGWALFRNAFLVIQGVGVMVLILRDALRQKDTIFVWIGAMIALSFAFYTPVILWSETIPLLGMLMIPKTCAYVAVALIAYRAMYAQNTGNLPELTRASAVK
jgi:hypothetical protein